MEDTLSADFMRIDGAVEELRDFDFVVRSYQPRIFRFLLASLRDRDSAETLTQECFMKAYTARRQFRGDSSVSTWLMRIAINLLRDHLRNRRLQFWRQARQGIDVSEASEFLRDTSSSPEAQVVAQQQIQAMWEAARELSDRQRTVFLLRFVEDMDLREISNATGMKEATVKTHLFRALQSVREKLRGRL